MTEIDRIVDQHRRACDGEAWHGPSVREALAGVTAAQAATRPIASAHSIWELVHHITAWEDIVRRRLDGERFDVTPEMDWPPVREIDNGAWKRALLAMEKGHSALRESIARSDPARLDRPPSGGPAAYMLMHGAIQHDLYHAGQIILLKKGAKR